MENSEGSWSKGPLPSKSSSEGQRWSHENWAGLTSLRSLRAKAVVPREDCLDLPTEVGVRPHAPGRGESLRARLAPLTGGGGGSRTPLSCPPPLPLLRLGARGLCPAAERVSGPPPGQAAAQTLLPGGRLPLPRLDKAPPPERREPGGGKGNRSPGLRCHRVAAQERVSGWSLRCSKHPAFPCTVLREALWRRRVWTRATHEPSKPRWTQSTGARSMEKRTERPESSLGGMGLEKKGDYDPQSRLASAPTTAAMEALGSGGNGTSPASSTHSLDLRWLSTRADSAYSSFSTVSNGPEPHTPSPGPDVFPYLDWDYVRVVWGSPAPASAAVQRTYRRPWPESTACSGPHPPEVHVTPRPLSRQATPLLYALAAEAEAAARAAEPLSPPASRAAYRLRLQGAQQRVLRETSFQRKELRMSLPARLRPAALARPAAAHPRSASLSHPGVEVEGTHSGPSTQGIASRGRLANQQLKWCFSEPGKLDRMGRGAGPAGECSGEACFSSGFSRPKPQEMQHQALAGFDGHRIGSRPRIQLPGTASPDPGSSKVGEGYRSASQRRSASDDVLGSWGGPEGIRSVVQAIPQVAEPSRPFCQTKLSRCLIQKEAAVMCPTEDPQSNPATCEKRFSETCIVPTQLPSLPDDEVFLEEDSCASQGLPTSTCASDQHGSNLGHRAGRATILVVNPLQDCPETAGADDCWQGVNSSMGVSRPTCCNLPGAANGDIPTMDDYTGQLITDPPAAAESDPLKPLPVDALGAPSNGSPGPPNHTALAWGTGQPGSRPMWPSQHLEELVQELARLDPSLSDTLVPHPSPEPHLDLLDGLIPLAEVRATVGPACGGAGKEAAVTSEPRSCPLSSTHLLLTPQEETRSENPIPYTMPDQPSGQGCPEPISSIQAKKVELADLLQKMLQDLRAEQEQLRRMAQDWARCEEALETAVGQACAPRELERFSRFMADLERVLGLLLLLGSRLARVHQALARAGVDGDPEERASLLQRLWLLQRQQEDAKELKEHVARRERALREVLVQALPAEGLHTYCSLLAGKAAVLAQQRSLDDRARLLQDQLEAVKSGLGHSTLCPRPAWSPETHPQDKPPFPPPLI